MTPHEFHAVYRELIDENPLAIRAVLKILHVRFTDRVQTLAVTCAERPELLVNLEFVSEHCRTDAEVKAVICHEFLHVLLRHTDRLEPVTPAEHLALDAVINAIIHRTLGPAFSGMMSRYYARTKGLYRLLRPLTAKDQAGSRIAWLNRGLTPQMLAAWSALYGGQLVADDIRDLARDQCSEADGRGATLIGNHDASPAPDRPTDAAIGGPERQGISAPAVEQLRDALDAALRTMNGSGIFRSPTGRGLGALAYQNTVAPANRPLEAWCRETYAVLRRHLVPDAASTARELAPASFVLPVLSTGDRRAALRALWSPFLPGATWTTEHRTRAGSANVYLDVSGSMNAEMPLVVSLLGRLSRYIRRPFWAFSTVVAPARIENGHLVADTTGGTSMACVLAHIAHTRPAAAIVVTDGYIEPLNRAQVDAIRQTRLHAILTRDGSPAELHRAGLRYTQLSRLP